MTEETVSATATISASAETVFAVLADPSRHAAVDGTANLVLAFEPPRVISWQPG